MKKILSPFIFLTLIFLLSYSAFAKETVTFKTVNVKVTGGSRSVNVVYIDLKDKSIKAEAQVAKKQIGQTDDFKNIINQAKTPDNEVVAAINGTFFFAYTDMKPAGVIENDGMFYHLGSTGSVMGFSTDNKVVVDTLKTSVKGAVNDDWTGENSWYAWNINSMIDNKDSIVIFDQAYGKVTPKHDRTSIIVDKHRVTAIKKGQAGIPANGFVIVLQSENYIKRFHIGDRVDYRVETKNQSGSEIDWSSITTAVGAGPTLLKNGVIMANAKKEGFTEAGMDIKVGQKSFAGVTKDNVLILATAAKVTLKQAAEICKSLGMINAINLDGGASSSLYYKGKVITTPGRKLSNALVITRSTKTEQSSALRYSLNGKEVISKSKVYIDSNSNELMVPLKETCDRLYADYTINNSSITVKRYTITLKMQTGSATADVAGKTVTLKASPVVKNGVLYVPVHAFIVALGGSNSYDSAKDMHNVTITNYNLPDLIRQAAKAYNDKDYNKSINLYKQVLALKPDYSRAYYLLGYMYKSKNNIDDEIKAFEEYLKYEPKDISIVSILSWAYISKKDNVTALVYFEKAAAIDSKNITRWITLGQQYKYVKNFKRALEAFQTALTLNPSEKQRTQLEGYIAECKRYTGG